MSPLTDAEPTPKLIINGTVRGPVIAPPASSAIETQRGDTKMLKIKISEYTNIMISLNGSWKIVLKRESTIAQARPALLASKREIVDRLETFSCTCLPSISKLGSAIATKKAITAPEKRIKKIFLLLIRLEPRKEPIGIIPISMPCKKKARPKMIRAVPFRKETRTSIERGVSVKCKSKTKIGIGNSEKKADFSLDLIFVTPF